MIYSVNNLLTIITNCHSDDELDRLRDYLDQYGYPSQPESFQLLINIRRHMIEKQKQKQIK